MSQVSSPRSSGRDRPIIFSGSMVRALLEGRKTQTRRLIKPAPFVDHMGKFCAPDRNGKLWNWGQNIDGTPCLRNFIPQKVHFAAGDRLWVREAHAMLPRTAYRASVGTGTIDQREHPTDGYSAAVFREGFDRSGRPRWRPSIHMPRWASRLTLTITDVRVQRLQEVSDDDAVAEGVYTFAESLDRSGSWDGLREPDRASLVRSTYGSMVQAYRHLWNVLHGPDAWAENPWIVALTFSVERANIDAVRRAA